jgi:hypothetical protein
VSHTVAETDSIAMAAMDLSMFFMFVFLRVLVVLFFDESTGRTEWVLRKLLAWSPRVT